MEQTLGNITHYLNLKLAEGAAEAPSPRWLPIEYSAGKLPWTVSGGLMARKALGSVLPEVDGIFMHTTTLALMCVALSKKAHHPVYGRDAGEQAPHAQRVRTERAERSSRTGEALPLPQGLRHRDRARWLVQLGQGLFRRGLRLSRRRRRGDPARRRFSLHSLLAIASMSCRVCSSSVGTSSARAATCCWMCSGSGCAGVQS